MKRCRLELVWFLGAGLVASCPALAAPPAPRAPASHGTLVKLATLVPDGTVWYKTLVDLGDEWSSETQGRVTLRIYPGGVAGEEQDMVRKMRIGQIQASALTVLGLASVDESFDVFATPMMFGSYDELLYVLDKMTPVLKQRLEAKGFVLLNWGHAGWLQVFTKQPVQSVSDLKKLKIFVGAGDDRMVQMWKDNGFQPVALAVTDLLTSLQTGMIDALPSTPLIALQLQWFRMTPYMVDTGLAPLVGGLLITRQAWNKIPEADRAKLLEACKRAEAKLQAEIPLQDKNAVAEMAKRGLKVTHIQGQAAVEWRAMAEKFAGRMRGTMVPAEIVDQALRERDAYRRRGSASSP